MIPQPTQTDQGSGRNLSPQEEFVCLLIASARADGSVSAHEANSIEHIIAGMPLFRGQSHDGLYKVFATASERIKEHGVASVVQAAATFVPKELLATPFAAAIDLVLSDEQMSPKEEGFADNLGTLLNVERDAATKVIDVLHTKNGD
jgi:hypothetical protein